MSDSTSDDKETIQKDGLDEEETALAQIQESIAEPFILPPEGAGLSILEHLNVFLDSRRAPGTRKLYKGDIIEFYQGRIPTSVEDLQNRTTTANIIDWKKFLKKPAHKGGLGLKANTINRKLTALRVFISYLQIQKLLTENPAHPFLVPNEKYTKWTPKGWLSIEDIQQIMKSIAQVEQNEIIALRDQAIIHLGFTTLLRRSEIANVSTEDIKRAGNSPVLFLPNTKGGEDERVPLPPSTKTKIENYLMALGGMRVPIPDPDGRVPVFVSLSNRSRFRRISDNYINRMIKTRAKQAGLSISVHPHLLRHSGITFLLEQGESIVEVQKLARHKDPKTTQVYNQARGIVNNSTAGILSDALDGIF